MNARVIGRHRSPVDELALLLLGPGATGSMHDRAYAEIRRALTVGAVEPGARLSLRALSQALGTSPMPVREALRDLVTESVIEPTPDRAFRIPVLSRDQYREILRIRLRLEGYAAELAAAGMTPAPNAELWRLHHKTIADPRPDMKEYLTLNQAFHFTIYRAAGMPLLLAMIENLWLRVGPLLHACMAPGDLQVAYRCHRAALLALDAGDTAVASRALQEDLLEAAQPIFRYLDSLRR